MTTNEGLRVRKMTQEEYKDFLDSQEEMQNRKRMTGPTPAVGKNLRISLAEASNLSASRSNMSLSASQNLEECDLHPACRAREPTGGQLHPSTPQRRLSPLHSPIHFQWRHAEDPEPTLPSTFYQQHPQRRQSAMLPPDLATVEERRFSSVGPSEIKHIHDEECGHKHNRDDLWKELTVHDRMSQLSLPSIESLVPRGLSRASWAHRTGGSDQDDGPRRFPPTSSARVQASKNENATRPTSEGRSRRNPSPTSTIGSVTALPALPVERTRPFSRGRSPPSVLPPRPRRQPSRGRALLREARSASAHFDSTPSLDMIVPHPGFRDARDDNMSITSRTLGQSRRGAATAPPTSRASPPTGNQHQKLDPSEPYTYAWGVACCGFFVTFSTWGLNTSFGIFQAYYATVLLPASSLTQLAWIGSTQLFLMFFLGGPIGLYMDRGYFRVFFNGGSALLLVSLFATSYCTLWWHFFFVQGILTGLGMGLLFPCGVIVLMSYFPQRNIGRAMAIGAAGSPLGAIVYVAAFRALILHVSFGTTVRILAAITAVALIPPNISVRQRNPLHRNSYNYNRNRHRRRIRHISNPTLPDSTPPSPAAPKITRSVIMQALNDPAYLILATGFFFAFWALYITTYFLPLYAITTFHVPGSRASLLLILLSATNLLGRVLPGYLSDAVTGPLNLLIPAAVFSALTTFVWIRVTDLSGLYIIAAFYGFFSAGVQALYSPALHAFNAGAPETMGVKSGVVFTVVGVACLTGAPVAGALVGGGGGGDGGDYLGAQVFSGVSMLAAAGFLTWSRWMKVGWTMRRC